MPTNIECDLGGTPTHFVMPEDDPGRWCSCHGAVEGGELECDGTEENSVCLLGCEECYTMLKEKREEQAKTQASLQNTVKAYNKQKKKAEDLQKALKVEQEGAEEARKLTSKAQKATETAENGWTEAKREIAKLQQELASTKQVAIDIQLEFTDAKQKTAELREEEKTLLIETQTKLAEVEEELRLLKETQWAERNSLAGSATYSQ